MKLHEIHGVELQNLPRRQRQSIPAALLHFLGEIEAVFGIWVIPLALAMWFAKGSEVTRDYLNYTVSYVEPLFVVVIMAIAASRPSCRRRCACSASSPASRRPSGGGCC